MDALEQSRSTVSKRVSFETLGEAHDLAAFLPFAVCFLAE